MTVVESCDGSICDTDFTAERIAADNEDIYWKCDDVEGSAYDSCPGSECGNDYWDPIPFSGGYECGREGHDVYVYCVTPKGECLQIKKHTSEVTLSISPGACGSNEYWERTLMLSSGCRSIMNPDFPTDLDTEVLYDECVAVCGSSTPSTGRSVSANPALVPLMLAAITILKKLF